MDEKFLEICQNWNRIEPEKCRKSAKMAKMLIHGKWGQWGKWCYFRVLRVTSQEVERGIEKVGKTEENE